MLKAIRSLFSDSSQDAARHKSIDVFEGLPTEIASAGTSPFPLAATLVRIHDLPTPDWERFDSWLTALANEDARNLAWNECELAWLLHLANALGSSYRVSRRDSFLVLSSLAGRPLTTLLDFMSRVSSRIGRTLEGIAKAPSYGYTILIVVDDEDSYYRYVSRYYPDDGEFSFSGGMHINQGCSHFVTTKSELAILEPVIVHEMTHGYLSHLAIPAWLNEGIAVNTEHRIAPPGRPLYTPTEMHQKHVEFWGEGEIQEFWSGASFLRTDDGNMLSYDLARTLVGLFSPDWGRFRDFVNNAHFSDAGAAAAAEHLGIHLGAAVCSILEYDPQLTWDPQPASWPTPPETGAFYPKWPNPALQPTAGKRRLPVPSSRRSSAAAELGR